MQELIRLSRAVAAELAAEFRGDPRGEVAAWLQIALEREGLVATLYEGQSIKSHLKSFPKHLARSVIAKVNGICRNEEAHLRVIRALVARDCPWPQLALTEGWGRLQGFVLSQLASTNAFARAVALILLEIGARSAHERTAAKTVAGLEAGGFLRFSRTLEVTAAESYGRVVALLATLRRRKHGSPDSCALQLKILPILRDERVHRDVLHVLCGAFGGDGVPPRRPDDPAVTELPTSITTRPISSRADLNAVCRAILTFHYGAVLPSGAPPAEVIHTAIRYWRWQIENPSRKSYLVDCQQQDLFVPDGDILLLGTAGLDHVVRGVPSVRLRRLDRDLIARLLAEDASFIHRHPRVGSRRSTRDVGMRRAASSATESRIVRRGQR